MPWPFSCCCQSVSRLSRLAKLGGLDGLTSLFTLLTKLVPQVARPENSWCVVRIPVSCFPLAKPFFFSLSVCVYVHWGARTIMYAVTPVPALLS